MSLPCLKDSFSPIIHCTKTKFHKKDYNAINCLFLVALIDWIMYLSGPERMQAVLFAWNAWPFLYFKILHILAQPSTTSKEIVYDPTD